jgi:ribosomal protein S21
MVIPVFRVSKGENFDFFLREYKRACIYTGLKTIIE